MVQNRIEGLKGTPQYSQLCPKTPHGSTQDICTNLEWPTTEWRGNYSLMKTSIKTTPKETATYKFGEIKCYFMAKLTENLKKKWLLRKQKCEVITKMHRNKAKFQSKYFSQGSNQEPYNEEKFHWVSKLHNYIHKHDLNATNLTELVRGPLIS